MTNRRKRNDDVERQEKKHTEDAEQSAVLTKLGNKIRETREGLGISQEILAHEMGYSSSNTVYRYETGCNQMGVGILLQFSKALNKTPDYLLEDSLAEIGLLPEGYAFLTEEHKRMVNEMIRGLRSIETNSKNL